MIGTVNNIKPTAKMITEALRPIFSYTRDHGLQQLNGITMPNNTGMIALAKQLGFSCKNSVEDGIVTLRLALESPRENSHS